MFQLIGNRISRWRKISWMMLRQMATSEEKRIKDKIKRNLREYTEVIVEDTSGGCGTMYNIQVSSKDFMLANINSLT